MKGLQKIFLAKGETKNVTITVNASAFKFYNSQLHYIAEPGEFILSADPNSRDLQSLSVKYK